ncbi:MAG: four helix bundle protein [Bacteroidales bacterium]|nr:four helix bundle protein [Bacteroidales bacterium]
MILRTFEDLEVWKIGRQIRKEISILVKQFPVDEKYRLTDQMLRASRSVTNNIAEGYGRFHYQENIQFCRHSRGSLDELIDHLIVALDEEYISEEQFNQHKSNILQCIKVLNGYISYLKKAKEEK